MIYVQYIHACNSILFVCLFVCLVRGFPFSFRQMISPKRRYASLSSLWLNHTGIAICPRENTGSYPLHGAQKSDEKGKGRRSQDSVVRELHKILMRGDSSVDAQACSAFVFVHLSRLCTWSLEPSYICLYCFPLNRCVIFPSL